MSTSLSVDVTEAQSTLYPLLDAVECRTTIGITRDGLAIAKVVPVSHGVGSHSLAELRAQAAQLSAQVRASATAIRDWIDADRK